MVNRAGVHDLVCFPGLCHCHASVSHSQRYQSVPCSSLGLQQLLQHTRGMRLRHAGLAPEKPQWTPRPHSQPFPDIKSGNHLVNTLVSNGHLPSQSTKSVNINVWSDCSGINSEMFALQTLSDNIKEIIGATVQCNLYYTCDSDTKIIVFARHNHAQKSCRH